MYQHGLKRILDFLLALSGLLVLSPMLLVTALAVYVDDPGPVLFRQIRYGLHQEPFEIWKFRSMRMDAPHDMPTFRLEQPERYITRVGKVLRKTSLDELPQLVQVLTGKMSLVGPRPVILREKNLIDLREQVGANDVRPGITGWAQVNGRDELSASIKARFDGEYVAHLSFWFDVKCILLTVVKVLRREGIVEGVKDTPEHDKGVSGGLKILVVSQHYQPEPFRLSDLCETLVAQGHEVTAVVGTPNYPEGEIYPGYEHGKRRDEVIGGVKVHRCPLIPRKHSTLFRLLNYFSFPITSSLYTLGLKEKFDVVYCHQTSPVMMAQAGLAYAKKYNVPSVLYCMDLWPECLLVGGIHPGSLIYRIFLGISRRIYQKADTILTSSMGFERYFMEVLKLPTENLHYVPQYAETLFDDIPEKKSDFTGAFHVMFAGNVGAAQSVETIVEAARILRHDSKIHLHVVGDGTSLQKCIQLAKGLENITFHGRKDLREMPRYYAMADAMLLTLQKNGSISHTLPGKVQSYMAAGKPIIAAAEGGSAEVIAQANCGLCGAPSNAAELAENIRYLANHPKETIRFGRNARAYYQNYFSKEGFFIRLNAALCGQLTDLEAPVSTPDTIPDLELVASGH